MIEYRYRCVEPFIWAYTWVGLLEPYEDRPEVDFLDRLACRFGLTANC